MRLSELLWNEVRDGRDRVIGVVHDVRVIEQRGEEGVTGLSVQGIVVGPRRAVRIASTLEDLKGPFLLRLLDGWSERRLQLIPWSKVESMEKRTIRIKRG